MPDQSNDPRVEALVAVVRDEGLRALARELMRRFEQLETLDFGELEPVGVASPTWWR